jgi:hypothetical protein
LKVDGSRSLLILIGFKTNPIVAESLEEMLDPLHSFMLKTNAF